MIPTITSRHRPGLKLAAVIVTALAVSATGSAQTPPAPRAPPTATECSALIRGAQDDAQRQRMSKEDLERTNWCLNLMKQTQPTPNAPIKIFRN